MRSVSVTISTFNRCDLLRRILIALDRQTVDASAFEVIVCDSHSIDGTGEMVAEMTTKVGYELQIVHTKNNLAAKRNIGIDTARHPLVIFLDDDCLPDSKFVEDHLQSFSSIESGQRIIFCGEVRYPESFLKNSNYYRFRDSRHYSLSGVHSQPILLDYRTIVVMNMCFEKDLFLQSVGNVDESFIGYGAEDQDLGWRLQKAGYQIRPCAARIDHYETTGTISAYGSKIRRSSRDGMTTLIRVNPEAAFGIEALRKLDRTFPNRTALDRLVLLSVTFLIMLKLYRPLEMLLEMTDRISWLYFPSLYRFLMGVYYVQGAADRKRALTAEQAELGWDGP